MVRAEGGLVTGPVISLKEKGASGGVGRQEALDRCLRMPLEKLAAMCGKPASPSERRAHLEAAVLRGVASEEGKEALLTMQRQEDVGRGAVPPLSQIVPRETREDAYLRRLAASVGLSVEQARQLGQRGLTVAQIQELLAEFRGANRKGAA